MDESILTINMEGYHLACFSSWEATKKNCLSKNVHLIRGKTHEQFGK